ncbi:MAG: glycoside hydrolase family 44 protein [Caldilineaceae bacterium]
MENARRLFTGRAAGLLWLFLLVMASCILPAGRSAAVVDADFTVFGDTLTTNWQDWSWQTTHSFDATSPTHTGTHSISVHHDAAWTGFSLRAPDQIETSGYEAIEFWIYGAAGGTQIVFYTQANDGGDASTQVAVSAPAGSWTKNHILLSDLGNPATIARLNWQEASGAAQATYYLDDIRLVSNTAGTGTPTVTPTLPANADITLTVNVNADRHPISDLIYGMNWGDEAFAQAAAVSVRRWGGNRATRYNWQNDMGNAAYDWYFENGRESNATDLPNDSAANRFIAQDRSTGAASYLTVPMAGYVSNGNEAACGFSTSKYSYTPTQFPNGTAANDFQWRPQCGNGVTQFKNNNQFAPVFFKGNDPFDTSIAITESFVGSWVNFLTGKFGTANNGGVRFYGLDNEPDLWNSTHADIHPQGQSYNELAQGAIAYARAIKRADPSAQVLGPEFGGWWAYFTSAKDVAAGSNADRQAHGNLELTAWYLQQLAAYEQQHGTRLLDYLSLHFYPQEDGVPLGSAGNATTQALRLRSVRALWDPTYQDESWIASTADGPVVRLIPRMRAWIDQNYPGTKLAISEYNWGGHEHINGALAQADILGIFGRERVDLATIWDPPAANQPAAYAFRIYRNYDGAGATFGDVSVQATSSDQAKLAIYAAQRSSDNSLTLMMINKTGNALAATLALSGMLNGQLPAKAEVYRYSTANLSAIVRQADQAISGNGFMASYPANSITLVRIAASNGGTPTASPTPTVTSTPPSTAQPSQTPNPTDEAQLYLPLLNR